MKNFDVVIIGGGPGGMTAGIMLSQNGKSVAIVQMEQDSFGGTCLNRGCMPTKSMLKAATTYRHAKQAGIYGLDLEVKPVDLARVRAVADQDIAQLREMVQGMFAQAPITAFRGQGAFTSDHEIMITKSNGVTDLIRGETIIVATGSQPVELPFAPFDGRHILSSDHLLRNTELPETMLIVGGGAVGCEFATLYHTFGSKIILVEALASIIPREDREAGKMLQSAFENQGLTVKTQTRIERLEISHDKVQVHYAGDVPTDTVDKVLVAIGRRPNIEHLNLQAAGVVTEKGAIKVNPSLQTNIPHIYALGDVISGMSLAHSAEKEGQVLAMNLLNGTENRMNVGTVPRVAFCHPEVAAIGVTEADDGIKTLTLPQVPNGRALVDKVAPAFMKLFVEEKTERIAGAVIIGEAATEMIHELALAMENKLTLGQIAQTVHVHPTHSKNILHAVQHALHG